MCQTDGHADSVSHLGAEYAIRSQSRLARRAIHQGKIEALVSLLCRWTISPCDSQARAKFLFHYSTNVSRNYKAPQYMKGMMMLSIPEAPTPNEWLVLLQEEPDRAEQHLTSLRNRIKKENLMAHPALTFSIEAYDEALHFLENALKDTQDATELLHKVALGRRTLEKYPGRDEWITLLHSNPVFARSLYFELVFKSAFLGTLSPPNLATTIAAYDSVIG
jgi:hypothetical protein